VLARTRADEGGEREMKRLLHTKSILRGKKSYIKHTELFEKVTH